jgi:hypothetical protein
MLWLAMHPASLSLQLAGILQHGRQLARLANILRTSHDPLTCGASTTSSKSEGTMVRSSFSNLAAAAAAAAAAASTTACCKRAKAATIVAVKLARIQEESIHRNTIAKAAHSLAAMRPCVSPSAEAREVAAAASEHHLAIQQRC